MAWLHIFQMINDQSTFEEHMNNFVVSIVATDGLVL